MNINFSESQLDILNKIIDSGYAFDFESAVKFLIHYYDFQEQKRSKSNSNEVA